nr:hypothetical protein [Megamonas hypermegale]
MRKTQISGEMVNIDFVGKLDFIKGKTDITAGNLSKEDEEK